MEEDGVEFLEVEVDLPNLRPQLVPVKKVIGPRGTPVFTDGQGHFYRKDCSRDEKVRMRCTFSRSEGCKGSATMIFNENGPRLQHLTPHSCSPNSDLVKIWALKRRILDRCASLSGNLLPLRQIFEEECSNSPPNVAAAFSFSALESAMRRVRKITAHPLAAKTESDDAIMLNGTELTGSGPKL